MTHNRAADGAHRPSAAQTTPKNAMPTLLQRLSSLLRPAASAGKRSKSAASPAATALLVFDQTGEVIRAERRLREAGLHFEAEPHSGPGRLSDALEGKSIVISGNFSISRDKLKETIAAHGGKAASSISSRTAFLVAGEKSGPEKLRKCAALGIPVISEQEFFAMLPDTDVPGGKVSEPTLF